MALTRTPINGQRLKRLRKEAGLSQEALAERLSITRETVNKIENNKPGTIQSIEQLLVENWWAECQEKLPSETKNWFIEYLVSRFTKST